MASMKKDGIYAVIKEGLLDMCMFGYIDYESMYPEKEVETAGECYFEIIRDKDGRVIDVINLKPKPLTIKRWMK